MTGRQDTLCGTNGPLRHRIGELVVLQPVPEVPSRVRCAVEPEPLAAEECDAFCFDFAYRAATARPSHGQGAHVQARGKRLVWECRNRVDRDFARVRSVDDTRRAQSGTINTLRYECVRI